MALQTSISVACGLAVLLAVVFTVLGIRRTGRLGRPHSFVEGDPAVDQAVTG